MSMRSWIRKLFIRPAHRPVRMVPRRSRMVVEALEDRLVPSAATDHILVKYTHDAAVHKVALHGGVTVGQALADYKTRGGVAYAEADQVVSAAAVTPSDPSFGSDWGLNNTGQTGGTPDADIDAPEAWDVTRGSMSTVVAVIDSGIDYTHRDLYQNIWLNPGEVPAELNVVDADGDGVLTFRDLNLPANTGKATDLNHTGYIDAGDLLADSRWANTIDDGNNGYVDDLIGWDFVNNDNNPMDDYGHGTHVAGTVGASGNDGVGVAGVNWLVQMAALKFLGNTGSGPISSAVAALDYAVANHIPISNNSWIGYSYSETMYSALVNAEAVGHIFVAAAGNGGPDGIGDDNDGANRYYPASYDNSNIIAVAASDKNDALTSFSNYGLTSVDLSAPGSDVYSTRPNNQYGMMSGTSMAAPHVTGVVALIMSVRPELTSTQIRSQILNNVDAVSSLSGKVASGGRLNAYKAVANLGPNTGGPMVVSLTPNLAADNSVSGVRVTFTEAVGNNPGTGTLSFTAADVTAFTGPSGNAIAVTGIQPVAGSGGKSFDVAFARQTTVGTYRLTVGPGVYDTTGIAMNQDGDLAVGEATQDQYRGRFVVTAVFTNTSDVKIKDFATVTSTIAIPASQNFTIGDVNVKVNLKHPYVSDLRLTLISPSGVRVPLINRRGGYGQNMTNTVFDEEAATPISAGAAPFTGSFRPEVPVFPELPLSALDGLDSKGTWTLEISDLVKPDSGTLYDWTLIFTKADSGWTTPLSPPGGGSAGVAVSGTAPGTPASPSAAAADVGASDALLFLFDATPVREQVPPSTRAADPPRAAPPIASDGVPVPGMMAVRPAPAAGRPVGTPAVGHVVEWFEQPGWQGDEAHPGEI